ncbi:site-specific DNA-methyltransferase [Pseudovibrio sp. Tun.PSC04-5.I4]|uniref:site-specific DNA-methyltransferase n=1 Tax=Pseudovibrio sp. Tun.PSC04-5.I4 TaxID=1798213 RepID=UPI000891D97D|nr:site-specific DNA-methyltransferase [Pseudovibrio sp. Tun.PSC04-5.I4]SDR40001.1 DNA modification methylase [Pseudovibrio sp. Tun.PSC04-5.I4]
MQVEMMPIAALVPYARNARTHPDWQITQIASSIAEFGFTNPILVGADNDIIAGHGRLLAAQRLELKQVPAIRLAHLSEVQRRALIIADNRIAENAGWDDALLREELAALSDDSFDLDVLGFSDEELGDLLGFGSENAPPLPHGDEDHVPSPDPVHASVPGAIWLIGGHRVMCGDSTTMEQMSALCAGKLVDAVWTDPPYNVNYEGAAGKIKNDNLSRGAFRKLLLDAFSCAASVMRSGAPIYVAHSETEGRSFRRAFVEAGFKLSSCLIWVKPALVIGHADYQWRHEPILYGWKLGASHSWYGGRTNTTVFEADGKSLRVMPDGSLQIDLGDQVVIVEGKHMSMRSADSTVIHHDKPIRSAEHPTMKPVSLIQQMLENSTKQGDLVLDPFGGSGSTLIACEKMGRKARLLELDPKYCDVIVARWQEYTGQKATLLGDGRSFDEIRTLVCADG